MLLGEQSHINWTYLQVAMIKFMQLDQLVTSEKHRLCKVKHPCICLLLLVHYFFQYLCSEVAFDFGRFTCGAESHKPLLPSLRAYMSR